MIPGTSWSDFVFGKPSEYIEGKLKEVNGGDTAQADWVEQMTRSSLVNELGFQIEGFTAPTRKVKWTGAQLVDMFTKKSKSESPKLQGSPKQTSNIQSRKGRRPRSRRSTNYSV